MSTIIDGLGTLGIFFIIILIVFIIISCLMWFLVPFWILSIKTSLKNIQYYLEKNQDFKINEKQNQDCKINERKDIFKNKSTYNFYMVYI